MRISIVTISYNQGRFLERAIRSVLGQDHDDVEHIIVDPGSTDGSRDIIEKYREDLAAVIFESDEGPADGLRKGFATATGDVFGQLNADDCYLPGALRRVAREFEASPDIGVVYGHGIIADGGASR